MPLIFRTHYSLVTHPAFRPLVGWTGCTPSLAFHLRGCFRGIGAEDDDAGVAGEVARAIEDQPAENQVDTFTCPFLTGDHRTWWMLR